MNFYRTCVVVLSFCLMNGNVQADWETPVTISDLTAVGNPQVAVDGAGNAVAVWVSSDGSNDIVRTSTLPFGGDWITPTNISSPGIDASLPQLAVNASGNAAAVWQNSMGTIQVSTFSPGGGWTASADITTSGVNSNPQVAIDESGGILAVWQNNTTGAIQGAFLLSGETMWPPPQDASVSGINSNPQAATIGFTGVIIWESFDGTDTIIQAYTGVTAMPMNVSGSGTNSNPQVVLNESGDAVAVWQNDTTGAIQLSAFSFEDNLWTPLPDASTSGVNSNPQVATNGVDNVFVWESFDGTDRIIQALSPLGLVSLSFTGVNSNPQVAVDPSGNTVAVWQDGTGIIQASTLTFGETMWTTPVGVSVSFEDEFPQVAIDALGNTVAVWRARDVLIRASTGTGFFAPSPPSNFVGEMCKNQFAVQIDRINQLSWTPSVDSSVVEYHIYRNGVLIGTVPEEGPFFFEDHNREKGVSDLYVLVSVNDSGQESEPVELMLS